MNRGEREKMAASLIVSRFDSVPQGEQCGFPRCGEGGGRALPLRNSQRRSGDDLGPEQT